MNSGQSLSEDFKRHDAASYDPVAAAYDDLIERYSGAMAGHVLTLANIHPTMQVLDVGTGTGIVALRAAATATSLGRVVGIDLSSGMLAIARKKAATRRIEDRVEFRDMDAERLEFRDASFDAVVSMFALHHFPNPAAALAEMYRVLKPGGTLSIGVGSGPSRFTVAGVLDAAVQVRDVVKQFTGRLLRAPQFIDHLVERHVPRLDPGELTALASHGWKSVGAVPAMVRAAGFLDVRTDWRGERTELATAEEFWELQSVYSSTARKRLATVPVAAVELVRREFFDRCAMVKARGGELIYSHAALYVTARRAP
jgi:ubiquinone/menaquinone biosynthesis C-methylase UbiE